MGQKQRAKDWLSQARTDIEWSECSLDRGFYAQTRFIAQQSAEKAMKGYAHLLGYDLVKGHSVRLIAQRLKINDTVESAAKVLDQYYSTARNPDSLPGGAPFESFTRAPAEEALDMAKQILRCVEGGFKNNPAAE